MANRRTSSSMKSTVGARKGGGGRKTAKSASARTVPRSRKGDASGVRGRKSAARGRASRTDVVSLLMQDHDRVEEMLDRFERARGDDRKQQLADRICAELTLHAEAEEAVFYPAVRRALDDDMMDEAEVEHATAKDLIAQIRAGKVGDPQWDAKVKVLGEYIKHHVKEEEREMFPKTRKTNLDLVSLGEELQTWKSGRQGGATNERAGRGSKNEHPGRIEQEASDESREPGLIESALRAVLPGGR